jgi:hypothetical protein
MGTPNAAYLAPSDFKEHFKQAWNDAQSRFFKIERRQSYNQAGDESFEAYISGDYETARHLVRKGVLAQDEMYAQARARGIDLVRLRLIQQPLSDYLRYYEIPSYFASEELGERIGFVEVAKDNDALPDCIIFDAHLMFINAYDGLDRLVGAIEIMDHNEIDRYLGLAESLLVESQPLGDFVRAHNL